MKKYLGKAFYITCLILGPIPYILFLANIGAQGLLIDDYTMLNSVYRKQGLFETLKFVISGVNPTHVRFTFIPHFFFLFFYRYTNGGRFSINIFFIILLTLLIMIFILILINLNLKRARTKYNLDLKPLINKQSLVLFILFSFLLLNPYVWAILDFKLANYLTIGFFIMLLFITITYLFQLKNKSEIFLFLILYLLTIHSSDLNVLSLVIIIPVVFSKGIKLIYKFSISAFITTYPIIYYYSIKAVLHRDSVLFKNDSYIDLNKKFISWMESFIRPNALFISTVVLALSVAVLLAAIRYSKKKKSRKSNLKNRFSGLINFLFEEERSTILALFLFIFPILLLYITNLGYGGWINPHHFDFAYLIYIYLLIICIKIIWDKVNRYRIFLTIPFLLIVMLITYKNFLGLSTYWKTRYEELSLITSLENHIHGNINSYGSRNIIVMTNWPKQESSTYTAFYNVSWASQDYAEFYLSTPNKKFLILAPNAILYWKDDPLKLGIKQIEDYDGEGSTLIFADYNEQLHSLVFTDYNCSNQCGEQSILILQRSGSEKR